MCGSRDPRFASEERALGKRVPPRRTRLVPFAKRSRKAFSSARLILVLGRLLLGVHLLLVHGLEHGEDELLALVPGSLDLPGELLGVVVAGGKLEVLADVAGITDAETPLSIIIG